jgi:hypothetical protein
MKNYVVFIVSFSLAISVSFAAVALDTGAHYDSPESDLLLETSSLPGTLDLLGRRHPDWGSGNNNEETLISGDIESGGCGGPVVKLSGINETFAVFVGGRGGWIINHTFVIGGSFYGLVTDLFVSGNKLHMSYGGLWAEYIINSDSLVHFTVGTLIGMGNAHYDPEGSDQQTYFVLEPEANVELNIVRFFRVCVGVSYRLALGFPGLSGLNTTSLNGLSANLFLKFGHF